jgi:hypothetical protein
VSEEAVQGPHWRIGSTGVHRADDGGTFAATKVPWRDEARNVDDARRISSAQHPTRDILVKEKDVLDRWGASSQEDRRRVVLLVGGVIIVASSRITSLQEENLYA